MSFPKVYIKEGVKINGFHMHEEMHRIIRVARATAPPLTDNAVWITSANDSKHMIGSLHYTNKAFDLRTRNIIEPTHSKARTWVAKMQLALGDQYDIVLEADHIHAEFDIT